jgi:hypothetical protein
MLESLQKLLSDWGIDQAEQLGLLDLLDADDIKQLSVHLKKIPQKQFLKLF